LSSSASVVDHAGASADVGNIFVSLQSQSNIQRTLSSAKFVASSGVVPPLKDIDLILNNTFDVFRSLSSSFHNFTANSNTFSSKSNYGDVEENENENCNDIDSENEYENENKSKLLQKSTSKSSTIMSASSHNTCTRVDIQMYPPHLNDDVELKGIYAPFGSLMSMFVAQIMKLCERRGKVSLKGFAVIWLAFVEELRYHYENLMNIPYSIQANAASCAVPANDDTSNNAFNKSYDDIYDSKYDIPDLSTCILHQKIVLLQRCIRIIRYNQTHQPFLESDASNWDANERTVQQNSKAFKLFADLSGYSKFEDLWNLIAILEIVVVVLMLFHCVIYD
jgi:hypothetical protein